MSKIEEVKKILLENPLRTYDGMEKYLAKDIANELAYQICQLFEPKPDEGKLLTDEEMIVVEDEIHNKLDDDEKRGVSYSAQDRIVSSIRAIAKAQDAKTAPIAYKQGHNDASTIKDAEMKDLQETITYLEESHEAVIDFMDAECQEAMNKLTFELGEVASKACQQRIERIFEEFETLFADNSGVITFIRKRDNKAGVENCNLIITSEWQALKREGIE